MAKIPVYQQQTKPSAVMQPTDVVSQPSGIHSGVAQAQQELGNTLLNIGVNIKNRSDTIDRVRQANAFEQEAVTQLERMSTEQDITDPKTTEAYRQNMQELLEKTVEAHSGGYASRAQLRASLEAKMGQYQMSATQNQIKAQHQLVATTIDKSVNSLSAQVSMSPDLLMSTLVDFEKRMDDLSGALSQSEEDNYRMVGRNKIITAAISGLLQKGDWQSAKNLMDDDNIIQFLTPESSRQISGQIVAEERKAEVAQEKMNKNVAKLTWMLGRNPNAEELMRMQMFPGDLNDMDVTDQIAMLELMQGSPVSTSQVHKIMKSGGTFGTDADRNLISENSVSYANGLLSPKDRMDFEAAVQHVYGPKQDPVTGMWTRQSMPPGLTDIMNRGSSVYGQKFNINDKANENKPYDEEELGDLVSQIESGEMLTIWEQAPNVTGPFPMIKRGVGRTPFEPIARWGDPGQRAATAKTQAGMFKNRLMASLRNNATKYLASEFERLDKELEIDPALWDNKIAYRARVEAIGQYMEALSDQASKDLRTGNLTMAMRQEAMMARNILDNALVLLMPPKEKRMELQQSTGDYPQIFSPEDKAFKDLPPGSTFIDANGKRRIKQGDSKNGRN